MGFFNGLAVALDEHINNLPLFSEDADVKKIQEQAENFKIHEAIRNIVNNGNPETNERGQSEWEECLIYYSPSSSLTFGNDGAFKKNMLGKITMSDGTILYESVNKASSGVGRYTEQFRMGKWVDRLLKYSEELSQQYQAEVEKKKEEAHVEKMKPFSEIDF